ncbi:MAG: flagellar assembly protein FliW [Eubacteriales bacterium]
MATLKTRDFGSIELPIEAIYQFPQGLYGFDSEKEFALFTRLVDDVNFLYLQSTNEPSLCFFVVEPWDLFPSFEPELSSEELKDLDVESVEELIFLSIAAIPSNVKDMTLNIKSPIVLNPVSQKGMQLILHNVDYKVRFQPFPSIIGGESQC